MNTKNGTKPPSVAPEPKPAATSLDLVAADRGSFAGLAMGPVLAPRQSIAASALGHGPSRQEFRIAEITQEQVLELHAQASKLKTVLQEWSTVTQNTAINTAQTLSLLTVLKGLSSDPDYQAWWASWSKFAAERYLNGTDDLLLVGASTLADILSKSVTAPGELVALWRSLFSR